MPERFAERFEAPKTVSFRAEWHGLQGRILKDPNHPWGERGEGAAREDSRVVERTVPLAELADGWPKLTADMLSPVMRMFDPYRSVSAEQVRAWSRDFREGGRCAESGASETGVMRDSNRLRTPWSD